MLTAAKVIADSISPHGNRLTTLEVTFHRWVLAEFNTHRVLSRNSASSRAIPIEKQILRLMEQAAIPVEWGVNRPGMQATELLDGAEADKAEAIWLSARDQAVEHATALMDMGVHKQITNRLLEPFMYHTVIATGTAWQNFFAQRCSPLAQPEIRVAAEMMQDAYLESEPQTLGFNDWHTPYIQPDEDFDIEFAKKISVARCARVSYLTHDGVRDPEKDLELFERLVGADPMHASPLEHVATPRGTLRPGGQGNFIGWQQYRHQIEKSQGIITLR